MASYQENQANDIVYMFNSIQGLKKRHDRSGALTRKIAYDLIKDTTTVGPESVDAVATFLTHELQRPKLVDFLSGKDFTSRLVRAIGDNNTNFRDTRVGDIVRTNHFGEAYTKEEVKYINSHTSRSNSPSIIMNSIEFSIDENGYVEATRKRTFYESCWNNIDAYLFK